MIDSLKHDAQHLPHDQYFLDSCPKLLFFFHPNLLNFIFNVPATINLLNYLKSLNYLRNDKCNYLATILTHS